MQIPKKHRAKIKRAILENTNFDANTIRINARGEVSARLNPDKVTGLTAKQRRFRGIIGHYPHAFFHILRKQWA